MENFNQVLETSLGKISLGSVCSAVITFAIGYVVMRMVLRMINALFDRQEKRLDENVRNLAKKVIKGVLYVVLAIIVAGALGIDTTSLIAAFSVVGLAISLAVQNTLTNVAGGLMLLLSKPFEIGDYIETGSHSGTVIELGLSYTKLKTPDNKVISIPNGDLSNTRITDYSTNDTRRLEFKFTASYDAPIPTVKKALCEAMEEVGLFLEDPAWQIEVNSYGDSSIEYVVRGWVNSEDYWTAYFAMNTKVSETFARHNVEMTYNHLNVHIK